MTVEVVVTVSPEMFREDIDLLRSWLDKAFPYDWAESPAPGSKDSLSLGDVVIMAAVAGASEVVAKAAVQAISAKIKVLAGRYPDQGDRPELAKVEVKERGGDPPDGNDSEPA